VIKISCVSYLNSAPFIYGIRNHVFTEKIQLSLDNPADCARKLISGEADIGLVPVASISSIPDAEIISDYCIGANGLVRSVTLLGEVPVTEMKTVLLDYQSRTSVSLVRILAREHWNVSPVFRNTAVGYEELIHGDTGGVVIGDRSLAVSPQYPFVYDLSGEWKKMTGLPFVFACWVSNRKVAPSFLAEFNDALTTGLNDPEGVIAGLPPGEISPVQIREYLAHSISYTLDEAKRKGLRLFLNYLKALEPLVK
jgi:chorismate dehydratase